MKIKKIIPILLSCGMIFTSCANSNDKKDDSKEIVSEAAAKGNNADVVATVTIKDGKIENIDLIHKETEGLGDKAADSIKEKMIEENRINIDTVSGATYTSQAVLEAVRAAIEKAGLDPKDFEKEGEIADKKESQSLDTDVVVVGGGGAGFAAAITAKEKGADVILVEKMPQVGGNTLISGGEYAAPANALQEKEGIEDSKDQFKEDVLKAGGNSDLVSILADKATDAANWLADDIGVKWLDELMFFGGHSVKRSLIPEGHTGNQMISKYLEKCEELGIKVMTEVDVKNLLSEDDKIVGIKADTKDGQLTINSKAVVLATGGFGANADMTFENDNQIDEHILSTNAKGATGDGIVMAREFGADTVDMDKIQLYPICDVETGKLLYVGDTRLVGGALLVNKEGKRFVEELDTRRAISMAIKEQTDYVGYLIWDDLSNETTGTMASNPQEAEDLYERGLLYKADTIEELAEHFDIDKDSLLETVENFNYNSKKGVDPDFNLRMLGWTIEKGPFYMLKAAPAVHHTMGGLVINQNAEVVKEDKTIIKGLYAAGELTGGIHGSNRLGSVAMADITVFGKIAGENAANFSNTEK